MQHAATIHFPAVSLVLSMPDDTTGPPSRGPVDTELLDRIAAHVARSDRFDDVQTRPVYAPNAVIAE